MLTYLGDKKILDWISSNFVYARAALPRNARVLEIGGGQNSHPASTVVVDKYLEDNHHRMGDYDLQTRGTLVWNDGSTEVVQIPLVQADVIELPFQDKSFDFVIAKDILEHVVEIEKAFQEISRVGKAGFIDVPKLESEFLFPQGEIHKWVFTYEGEFVAHSIVGFKTPFERVMHEVFAENSKVQLAWSQSRHYFHLVKFWQDQVSVRIGEPIVSSTH